MSKPSNLMRNLGRATKLAVETDVQAARIQRELAPLGKVHRAAEDALRHAQLLLTQTAYTDIKEFKALVSSIRDIADTMTALRREAREHIGASLANDASPTDTAEEP